MAGRELKPGVTPGVEAPGDGGRSAATASERLRRGQTGEEPSARSVTGSGIKSTPPLPPMRATGPTPSGIGTLAGLRGIPTTGLHATMTPTMQSSVRLGRYQVVNRIATGGMAEVYLAVHGELSGFRTPVVVKKVLPHLACNPHFIDMFLDEARIASLLDHPNVVRIYEVGRTGTEYFLAMELVQGKPLSALLRRVHERRELLDQRLAAFVVAQAAAGLNHAHGLVDPLGNSLGLVHRDVSPQNILISFEGSIKVIDFGIARALGRISDTQTGGAKGKFGYMSPEQAKGEDTDLRTDIFALGVVLWEAVCGRRLFQRENDLATMRALIYDPIPKPSSLVAITPELEGIVLRALSRNPKLRFQTALELAGALERYVVTAGGVTTSELGALMKGTFASELSAWQQTVRTAINLPAAPTEPTAPLPPTVTTTPAGRARRWPLVAAVLGAVALGLLGLLARDTGVSPGPRPAPPPPAAPGSRAPVVEPLPPALPRTDPARSADPAVPAGPGAAGTGAGAAAGATADPPRVDEPSSDPAKARSPKRRRSRDGSRSGAPAQPEGPPAVDRRPNPF
jgi:serine/threonine-protein kinase